MNKWKSLNFKTITTTMLNFKTISQVKSFLKKKCFQLLFENGEAATCSYS